MIESKKKIMNNNGIRTTSFAVEIQKHQWSLESVPKYCMSWFYKMTFITLDDQDVLQNQLFAKCTEEGRKMRWDSVWCATVASHTGRHIDQPVFCDTRCSPWERPCFTPNAVSSHLPFSLYSRGNVDFFREFFFNWIAWPVVFFYVKGAGLCVA